MFLLLVTQLLYILFIVIIQIVKCKTNSCCDFE